MTSGADRRGSETGARVEAEARTIVSLRHCRAVEMAVLRPRGISNVASNSPNHVQVKGASLENGLLHIDLVREIPEAMKPRAIPIASSSRSWRSNRPSRCLKVKPDAIGSAPVSGRFRIDLEVDRDRASTERETTKSTLQSLFGSLIAREQEVVGYVAAGLMNKQIAPRLE